MKKLLIAAFGAALTLTSITPAAAAGDSVTITTAPVVGVVDTPYGAISVWKADLPTSVWLEESSSGPCGYITFTIEALLPYSELDVMNGPEVEFELWSQDGEKISSTSIYRSTWNPISSLNKVKLFDCEDNGYGDFVLLVKTQYQVSTNGLISRYYENKLQQNLKVSPLPQVPEAMSLPREGKWTGGQLKFGFSKPASDSKITTYEIGYQVSKSSLSSGYPSWSSTVKVLKKVKATSKSFVITKADVKKIFKSGVNFASFTIRAVSDAGAGDWASGWYYSKTQVKSITK